jgi:hypothetical protein
VTKILHGIREIREISGQILKPRIRPDKTLSETGWQSLKEWLDCLHELSNR